MRRPAYATHSKPPRSRIAVSENNQDWQPDLDDAITGLMEYGSLKGWWEYDRQF